MLAFFCISVGLWGNFRQLWLASNNLSATSISKVISIASLVAAFCLLFYTKKFSVAKIKIGILSTLITKIFISVLLLLIDGTNNLFLIKFLSFFDIACENIILSSVYPYVMSFEKSEELYGKKSVVENLGKTLGILIGSLIFGRILYKIVIGYKTCLLVTIFFDFLALFVLTLTTDKQKVKYKDNNKKVFKYLKNHKLLVFYLFYNGITNMSFNIAVGLKMIMLTNYNDYTTSTATYFVLMFSIIDIIFGALAINKLKSKNDYFNISIKFLIRIILYLLVFITNNKLILLIAIAYSLITNIAYSNLISGFMTNTVKEKYILDSTVINYIFNLLGEATGVFLVGVMYVYGFRYIFLLAALITIIQIIMAYYLIYKKRKYFCLG